VRPTRYLGDYDQHFAQANEAAESGSWGDSAKKTIYFENLMNMCVAAYARGRE